MAGALDNRPYQGGMFSKADIYPNYGGWSTRDLTIPETREQQMTQVTAVTETAIEATTQPEKDAGNAGAKTPSTNTMHILLWAAVLIALLVVFHF